MTQTKTSTPSDDAVTRTSAPAEGERAVLQWTWDWRSWGRERWFEIKAGKEASVVAAFVVALFGLLFWVVQRNLNSGEPWMLTAFYRYWDYVYFPVISRMFENLLREPFLIDSLGQKPLLYPISGMIPYAVLIQVFGSAGYMVGDVLVHSLRLFTFWWLLGLFTRDAKARMWGALAIFFATSEFVLGDYRAGSLVKGLWGTRIPRPMTSSLYLILSLGVLGRLPQLLSQKIIRVPVIVLHAVPLVFLLDSDIYSSVSVACLFTAFIIYWLAVGKIDFKPTLIFVVLVVALNIPFLIKLTQAVPEIFPRLGRYPLVDHLATIEVPQKGHFFLLILSGFAVALLSRLKPRGWCPDLLVYVTVLFGFSFFASPLFMVMAGANVQEYQYATRRDQFGGLLAVLWGLYLISLAVEYLIQGEALRRRVLNGGLVTVAVIGIWISFGEMSRFAGTYAAMKTENEPGYANKQRPGWRTSAARVIALLDERFKDKDVVIGSLDNQINHLLAMRKQVYLYMRDPQHTPASDQEIEDRFMIFCAMVGLESDFMAKFLQVRETHVKYLNGGKFQFNRIHQAASLDLYPPQLLKVLLQFRDNWGIVAPPQEVERLLNRFRQVKANLHGVIASTGYRLPDVIVVNREPEFEGKIPAGYTMIFEDSVMRVFLKK